MVRGEQANSTSSSDPAAANRASEERAQLHLRLQYTVAQILSSARNEHEACAGILSTMCENLGWQWGAFWIRRGEELRLLACWHSSECGAQEFDQISRACVFRKGEGMPGKVWAEETPIWIRDFSVDTDMPRRVIAARCNFHSAIGIPICGQEFLGVIELFDFKIVAQDSELLKSVGATGAQIGQFLERKRTEQALAESQGLFQGVFQGARDSILIADDNGRCIEANSAALKLFGSSREQLLEKFLWDLVPFAHGAGGKKRWNEILETQGVDSELTLRGADGGIVDFEYRATPRVIPGVHLLVLRDMTGRKSRERSTRILAAAGAILGEGLDFKATINRVARVAIPEFADWCVLDLLSADGKIERAAIAHADPRIEEEVLKHAKELPIDPARNFGAPNVIRTGQTEFVEITPDVIRKTAGDHYQRLAQNLNLGTAVISPLKRQGRTFGALSFWRTKSRGPFSAGDAELAEELARRAGWALENARLYEAARQELELREKADAELKKLNAELEKRIEERTAALQESHTQLESFCYSVSHDLRAPLRSMQGFSHALIEDHSDKLDPEGQDFAQRILSAAEHMDGLLADVLAYSRLSRQELKLEAVNIDDVIEDARMQMQQQIRKRGADVQVAACGHTALVNRSVFELMLVNLLDNAVKFVPNERAPKITIECERRGDAMRIWVRDNGIGIPREHHQRIFRIFERLHGVEAYPGTGIGLALVQKAAERMNGAVGVESAPGDGSAFWIELPAAN
jgi:PAS domain S-box-containing protein